jgi:uncharacterized protein (DUF1015 family)
MPEITPFKGLCFNSSLLGSLDSVVTPPYDVITPEQRADLARRSSHSMVHLILPEERNGLSRYEAAAQDMAAWRVEDALTQDSEESFYILDQMFEYGGVKMSRRAFFATARIPEKGDPAILGHEQTFARTVEDRLSLTKSTRANLGPVFVLYSDPDGAVKEFLSQADGRAPDLAANTIDGVTQKLWRVSPDPAVVEFFKSKRLYIADGHHRYGTACAYRDLIREQEGVKQGSSRRSEFVLLGFVSLSDPGLAIYPTHRLLAVPQGFELEAFLRAAEKWFEITRVEGDAVAALESAEGCALVFAVHGDGVYLLRLKNVDRAEFLGSDRGPEWRDLDVAVLHRGIVQNVMGLPADTAFGYERDAATALERVERGEYGIGFLLKATRADQIQACAEAAQPMPHKSTYFFPKLPSGAVIHSLE